MDVLLTDFNRRAKAPDGLQARCRACSRVWYEQNRAAHIANVYRRNVAYRAVLAEKIHSYLAVHPCVDCGELDIRCLQFDHRDRATKTAGISQLVGDARSWELILVEIAKCDVRCANCHSRKTAAEINSWRHRVFLTSAGAGRATGGGHTARRRRD